MQHANDMPITSWFYHKYVISMQAHDSIAEALGTHAAGNRTGSNSGVEKPSRKSVVKVKGLQPERILPSRAARTQAEAGIKAASTGGGGTKEATTGREQEADIAKAKGSVKAMIQAEEGQPQWPDVEMRAGDYRVVVAMPCDASVCGLHVALLDALLQRNWTIPLLPSGVMQCMSSRVLLAAGF